MKNDTYKNINEIKAMPDVSNASYEQIFNMYTADDVYYDYNILKTIEIPDDLDSSFFYNIRVKGKQTWVELSYKEYQTQELWWLILLTNKIMNPVILPEPGSLLRILKSEAVNVVLNKIQR